MPIVVRGEDQETERGRHRHRRAIAAHPLRLARVPRPVQRHRRAGEGDIGQHLQPDRQRQRGGERDHHARPAHVGIGQPGDGHHQEGELPAMMVDAQRRPHPHRVAAAQQDRQRQQIAARRQQPTHHHRHHQEGEQHRQHRRDRAGDAIGLLRAQQRLRAITISAAIGRSTRRDQWMLNPPGGFSRYWRRSYQPWPASQSRTWLKRILSSVSLSANQWIACCFWKSSTAAVPIQNSNVTSLHRASITRSSSASRRSLRVTTCVSDISGLFIRLDLKFRAVRSSPCSASGKGRKECVKHW